MSGRIQLLGPTSEQEAVVRERLAPPASLDGLTLGLLDIGKARGHVFLDRLQARLEARGSRVRRYAKPTNTKVLPVTLAQQMAEEVDIVVDALSD